jgi:uncharacterized radical SAM superfamily Fe-S cluster-containing enzyme
MEVLSHRDILQYEEIHRLVSVAVPLGISHVRITGGEPLVRRGIVPFIASLRNITGLEDISVTTNGVLLEEMAEGLRAAGISRLNISLDTLDPKPAAPQEVRGDFKTIATSLPGIAASELLPNIAQNLHRVSLLRSMSHSSSNHAVSQALSGLRESMPAIEGNGTPWGRLKPGAPVPKLG